VRWSEVNFEDFMVRVDVNSYLVNMPVAIEEEGYYVFNAYLYLVRNVLEMSKVYLVELHPML
jgi:hypothetical protein